MDVAAAPVTLFYSYAHEDEALCDELQGHLKLLERRGLLAPWHDRACAGQLRHKEKFLRPTKNPLHLNATGEKSWQLAQSYFWQAATP